jgi:5-methylthioadenosine/S-adenosylhomocysteine deaminase
MVNGRWLMRSGQIDILDESRLLAEAGDYARRIDAFLIEREKSMLSKLIAIGGATEGESFEVQIKVRIADPEPVLAALSSAEIEILYHRHYHEYDHYFLFEDASQGMVRYREDEYLDEQGQVTNVRYRLTLVGEARERRIDSDVLLSRSRFLAPANHSLRFYREYFKPSKEIFIEKHRQRWRVLFQGTEFYVNLDHLDQPEFGYFVELKSRTWSRRDAEHKAEVATKLLNFLGVSSGERVMQDYAEIIDPRQEP